MERERILAWIRKHEAEYIRDLKELLRQPSVSAQRLGLEEMARGLVRMMKKYGVKGRTIPVKGGAPIVYGEIGKKNGCTLLFYNHYDVQPPEPLELWKTPPFQPDIRGGKIYARGVADNKGNILLRLAALQAYLSLYGPLPFQVKFLMEGEEEVGSPHIIEFVEGHRDLLKADACIWESGGVNFAGQPVLTMGCKGILYVELTAKGASRDAHSAGATHIPNPAWRLVHALSTLKDGQERILIDGFYDDVLPPSPEDIQALKKIPVEEEKVKRNLGLKEFLLNLKGLELKKRALFEPTCNICGILSGYTGPGGKTVLPSEARVKLDFRLVPNQKPEDIQKKLRAHLERYGFGDVVISTVEQGEYPARTPLNHPFVQLVREVAEEVYQQEAVLEPMTGGTGPMHPFIHTLGLPVVSTGAGYPDCRAHAPNENLRLSDIRKGIHFIVSLLRHFPRYSPSPAP